MWKPITDYPNYEVSDQGEVRNIKRQRLLKPRLNCRYLKVTLSRNGKQTVYCVHRLVADAFLGSNQGECVRHLDGNPLNNCLSNLAWGSLQDNQLDRTDTTLGSKLTPRNVRFIRFLSHVGKTYKHIASYFGLNPIYVGTVVRREVWTKVS